MIYGRQYLQSSKSANPAMKQIETEYDDVLSMLDADDLAELAGTSRSQVGG